MGTGSIQFRLHAVGAIGACQLAPVPFEEKIQAFMVLYCIDGLSVLRRQAALQPRGETDTDAKAVRPTAPVSGTIWAGRLVE